MDDDAALVARFLAGDQQALGDIYERYADSVYDLCRSILRSDDDAADAFQDSFLSASQKLHQLRDPSRLRPWLFSIARNQCRGRIRGRARTKPQADAGLHEAVDVDMTSAVVQAELTELIADARSGLSAGDQEVLDLHMRHGLEGDDLADVLGVSTQSAYKQVQRVRDRVERSLGALLVARHARGKCADLNQLLNEWDGSFTPLDRKRISRHVDECDECTRNRRGLLDPTGLASAMPVQGPPAAIRASVAATLATSPIPGPSNSLRRWRRDGFPGSRRLLRRVIVVGGIIAVLSVVATSALLLITASPTNDLVEVGAPETTTTVATTTSPSTTEPATTTSSTTTTSTTTEPATTTAAPTTSVVPPVAPTIPPPVPTTVLPPTTPSTTTSTTPTTTTTTTTTTTSDTVPPLFTAFRMTPIILWETNAAAPCGTDTASNAIVQARDDVGLASVRLEWTGGGKSGSLELDGVGTDWTGSLSFPSGTFQIAGSAAIVTVSAVATDTSGNATTSPTTIDLKVSSCP
jgi:RNA polymerase sigma factor (sigma-70 family)